MHSFQTRFLSYYFFTIFFSFHSSLLCCCFLILILAVFLKDAALFMLLALIPLHNVMPKMLLPRGRTRGKMCEDFLRKKFALKTRRNSATHGTRPRLLAYCNLHAHFPLTLCFCLLGFFIPTTIITLLNLRLNFRRICLQFFLHIKNILMLDRLPFYRLI